MARVVQTLILDREVFPTSADALSWASEHGYRADKVDGAEGSWRVRQRDPDDFDESTFRAIQLRAGVQVVIGELRSERRYISARERAMRSEPRPGAYQAVRGAYHTQATSVGSLGRLTESGNSGMSAQTEPSSWDPGSRTIRVVLSAEGTNEVLYEYWGHRWVEQPSLEPGHVRLDRANNGAPFLIQHRGRDERAQIGKFVEGSVVHRGVDGRRTIEGDVVFSRHLDPDREAYVQEIADGIRRNVSMGWRDYEFFLVPAHGDYPDRFVYYDWELAEGSSVTMGADDGSKFLSLSDTLPTGDLKEARMGEETQGCRTYTDREVQALVDERAKELAKERTEAAVAEWASRERAIRECGTLLEIDVETVSAWVDDPTVTVDQARSRAFAIKAARQDSPGDAAMNPTVSGGDDRVRDVDALRSIASLLVRDGRSNEQIRRSMTRLHDAKRLLALGPFGRSELQKFDFVGQAHRGRRGRIISIAEHSLRAAGRRPDDWGDIEVIEQACKQRAGGLNTTSAFPLLLAEVLNVSVDMGFNEVALDLSWAQRADADDFRTKYGIVLGESEDFEEVGEGEHYPSATLLESRDGWALTKYGKTFGITMELMVNDQHGVLTQVPRKWGNSGNRRVRASTFGLLLTNPLLADGTAVFAVARGNVDGVAAAPSIPTMDLMRVRMARRTGLDGTTTTPHYLRHLIVPEGRRTLVNQLLGRVVAVPAYQTVTVTTAVTEDFSGLNVVSDPLLDNDAGFLGGAAGTVWFGTDGQSMEYGWLSGYEGITITELDPGDIDGLNYKARMIFGAGFPSGWRGWDVNPGA